ncbi:UPF0382 membrane protein YwdK [Paenibacillus montaniterrae]|uniref:UPF0382 membrane protein YwdK n=1 Tax=Paenibacillus montaniterrae TaxID=429341 RepID=A0A920CXP9_9BACL|nr:DUF423 domain-containing protein [Paenibacillus montaniterrae]GIP15533.1 UPF0382 membrane protein YwdK [Paenibacillus montaniterrae]
MFRRYFIIGAIGAALAIAFGAFGAHGLKDMVEERMLANFETGVRYHMYSALGIMLIALASKVIAGSKQLSLGALLITIGTCIFSGSLYVMALTGITMLGAITPIGGVLMIAGWIFVVTGLLKFKDN